MCEVLVLLTDCAPLDVLLDPGPSSQPTEAVQNFSGGLILAWVSRQSVMVSVHDASSDPFVWWDDRFLIFVQP